jgi:hypothetical protein
MAHWRKGHESASNVLTSADLYDETRSAKAGRDVYGTTVVEIEKMTVEKVKSRQKPKGERRNFAHFKGHKKALGLNVTNAETLVSISGSPETARWVGLKIQLYVDPQADYPSGKKGPAIRIKQTAATGPIDAPPPELTPEKREQLENEHAERIGEREPGGDDA